MRKLNVKILVILLAVVFTLTAGAAVILYVRSNASAQWLAMARTAEEAGDYDTAVEKYLLYLSENRDNQEILCEAAIVGNHCVDEDRIADSKQAMAALRLMARALRSSSDRTDIRQNLARGLIAAGRLARGSDSERTFYAEAEKQIGKLRSQKVNDVELDFLYAQCADKLEKTSMAIGALNPLVGWDEQKHVLDDRVATAPEMIKAYVLLADLYRRRGTRGREDELTADAIIEKMVAHNSKNATAYLSRAQYLRAVKLANSRRQQVEQDAKILEDLNQASRLDPDDLDILSELVKELIRSEQFDLAEKHLAHAHEINPKDARIYIQSAQIKRKLDDQKAELAVIEEGLEVLPDNHQLINLLFTAQLVEKQSEQSKKTIERMKELRFRPEWIAFSEAKVLCLDEQWREASNKLEALRPRMVIFPLTVLQSLDHLLGRCYKALGQPDRQIDTYGRILSEDPQSQVALAGQAEALIALKRMPEALEKLTQLRGVMGGESFDSDEGLRALYLATLASLSAKGDEYRDRLEGAKQEYVTREDVAGSDKAVVRAEGLIRQGNLEEALACLDEALVQSPDAVRLQNTYLAILLREQGADATLEYLETATTRDQAPWTDRPELFLRHVELIVLAGGPHQAEKIRAVEEDISKYEQKKQAKLWKKVARTYYHLTPSRRADAKRCLRNAIAGDSDQVYMLGLFELAREAGNELEMQAQIDEAADRHGKNTPVPQFLEARYLLWKYAQEPKERRNIKQLEAADRLADAIGRVRPKWQRLLELKGQTKELQGEIKQAIDFYQESIDAGPLDVATIRHLVELLVQDGRFDEARETLLRLNTVPQTLKKEQLTLDLLTGNREAALTSLNQAAPIDSKNAEDWVRRGRVLLRLDKTSQAEDAFRRAVKLAPQLPAPSLALVEFLLAMQRPTEAEDEIRKIENRLSQDVVAQVMGQCYAWLGNRMLAEHYLAVAITNNPADMERERAMARYHMLNKRAPLAIPHLNAILERHLDSEEEASEVVFWARRSLARVLASLQTHRFFQQALALVEGNRQQGDLKSPDLNLKGLILAIRPEPLYRAKAIEILEAIPRDKLEVEERLALGQLYFVGDRWSECREVMQALLVDYPTDTRLLAKYVEMLIQKQEWRTLGPWMRQLQTRDPAGKETIRLTALTAKGRGKERPAVVAVESLIPEGVHKAKKENVLAAAALYEEIGLQELAESAYRSLADRDFAYRTNLAAHLARQGKLEEAFRICNAILTKENLLEICAIGIGGAVRHAAKIRDEELEQVQQWTVAAKREFPNSIDLITQEAALFAARASALPEKESKQCYREALELIRSVPMEQMNENQRGLIANNLAYMTTKTGGKPEVAIENINLAFELLGPRVELLDTRASIFINLGEYDRAIKDLKQATLFQVESGVYFFHLALAHQGNGNRELAEASLQKAEDLKFTGEKIDGIDREKYLGLKRWLRR